MNKTTRTTAADRIFASLEARYGDDIARGDAEVRRYASAQTDRFGWHVVWKSGKSGPDRTVFLGRTEAEAIAHLADDEAFA